jgi:phosphatidylglycerol lysyltransferase
VRDRVLELLKQHGWNSTSFQVLEPGFSYWFAGEDACVAYVDTGRAWVAAGAPIAAMDRTREVAHAFVAAARASGRRASFFAAESRLTHATGLDAVLLGEQPEWDPAAWEAGLAASRSLREQLRRARAKGVTVRRAPPAEVIDPDSPTRAALAQLVARWLASRSMAPMGFLVDVEPFAFAEERRYLVAEQAGRVVAFLVAVPVYARAGWLFEDLLRGPRAPNGTSELLVDAGMRMALAEGSTYVTLGLAPLAGPVPLGLRIAREAAALLYDFGGVHAFKQKLRPTRTVPIYLAYPPGTTSALALHDTLAAFARGSFTQFGLQTVVRGPAAVVLLLAALLVPWTMALALADARAWFPAPWVQHAWVAFDALLATALFALVARWRRWLGLLVALAVAADAVVTLAEAVVFNLPRIRTLRDGVIVAAACLAPTVASWILWGAVRTRAAVTIDAVPRPAR